MDQLPYSATWLSRWREEITDAVGARVSTFGAAHGYPPGRNEIRVADDDDRRTAREYARETLGFEIPDADDPLGVVIGSIRGGGEPGYP
ncbi:hypothetical protein ABTY96_08290 [Streptomyces sp. NPDC096057]|uniref:hypothetical protein n=1 Tax=Streptomyces sp. NPDC096057 TaxID=3155543 RepID=UPI003327B886